MRYFEAQEIPIKARHHESNGRIKRYHRSVKEEAFNYTEVENLYQARHLLADWGRYYKQEWLHSAREYLRPVDHYLTNTQALLAYRKKEESAGSSR